MRAEFGRRLGLLLLPPLGALFLRLWFGTCRVKEHEVHWLRQAEESGRPYIGTCWHYCVLGIFSLYRKRALVLMISASNDGDILARTAELLGFSVVRGSSNRKGASAAKEMIRRLRAGANGGLVADGSQGPARIAQSGSLLLAARSGGWVVPMLYSAARYHAFNTWDRLVLPKLFSRIDVFYGQPIEVPENVRSSALEEYRLLLDERLNDLYQRAWSLHGRENH